MNILQQKINTLRQEIDLLLPKLKPVDSKKLNPIFNTRVKQQSK